MRVEQLPELPEAAFDKMDPSPDAEFYAFPRFVTHIDEGAIAAVTQIYRERLPPGGAVLDLMSSWVSHLPDEIAYAPVVGHGMNAEELAANPRLSRWFVQDLYARDVCESPGPGNRRQPYLERSGKLDVLCDLPDSTARDSFDRRHSHTRAARR